MKAVVIAAAALTLGACSQNAGDAARDAEAPAASATALAASTPTTGVAPAADGRPRQRAGLWRVTTVMEGLGTQTQDQCVTPEDTAAALDVASAGIDGCSRPAIRRDGDAWTSTSVCGEGEARSEVSTRITGDFQTAMRAEVEMRTGGATTMRMTSTGTYVGPCPTG